jgi:hypothetical protein
MLVETSPVSGSKVEDLPEAVYFSEYPSRLEMITPRVGRLVVVLIIDIYPEGPFRVVQDVGRFARYPLVFVELQPNKVDHLFDQVFTHCCSPG